MATVDLAQARARYISAKEAVVLLEHLVTARDLQRWARAGRIPGAIKIGPKTVRFDRRTIPDLIRDLSAIQPGVNALSTDARPATFHDRRAHTTFDGPLAS